MEKSAQNLPDHKVATQRNDLLRGQQSFSLIQKRIFALAIKQITRDDDKLKMYTVDIQDLVDEGASRDIFNRIEEEKKNLMNKQVHKKESVIGSDNPEITSWNMITKANHHPGDGTLSIQIHDEIKDMLLQLKEQGNFTPIPVTEMMACRSSYGQRIYELLYSQRWKGGRWEVSVKELRFILNLEDKYQNFSGLRRYVLEKAQKDLKKHTNMRFDFETESRGKGRKITHIIFDFKLDQEEPTLPIQAKEREFNPKFDLVHRLRDNAELGEKRTQKVLAWLAKNRDQQQPLAYWLHQKVEYPNPTDSMGNSIRDMRAWAWNKIEKRMDDGGFQTDNISPNKPTKKPEIKKEKTTDRDKYPNFLKNLISRFD